MRDGDTVREPRSGLAHQSAVASMPAKSAFVAHDNKASMCAFRDRRKCTMVGTGVSRDHTFLGCVARRGVHLCYDTGRRDPGS